MPPRKTGKARSGSTSSLRGAACSTTSDSANIRSLTTLEDIINRQADNHVGISGAHSRIIALLRKLRGEALASGASGECRDAETGMLNGLNYALVQESLTIGELLADIEELEKLL